MRKQQLPKSINKLHLCSELTEINNELIPLKEMADREIASIYGLTGMLYTPHIDAYMRVCVKRAEISACLKRQKILPLSEVELISSALNILNKRTKNNAIVDYKGNNYQRRFSPLKLSKSGKIVRKWAKFWLRLLPDENIDPHWESQVREIWPTYFLIRTIDE